MAVSRIIINIAYIHFSIVFLAIIFTIRQGEFCPKRLTTPNRKTTLMSKNIKLMVKLAKNIYFID